MLGPTRPTRGAMVTHWGSSWHTFIAYEWATMVAKEYIVTAYTAYDLVGDFPRFLAAMFTRYVCYGSAPPLLIDSPVPEVQDSPAPVAPGYPTCPLSARDPTLLTEAEREAQEAARKGKAPMTDSEEDKEEDLPVAAPVGSSYLQAITVPSSYSHFHSAAEAAPPVLTKESMEDPHLIWNWVCGEDENNPILINSDEERGPKRERPQDSDSDSEDIRDCGYYTISGKWDPVRVPHATGCIAASARQGLILASTAEELDTLLRTARTRIQGREQNLTRQLSAHNCAQ
ncbi:hypothetical protein SASPL_105165 [Salvia splendens]|uniref:Uncharacterized protein n=1 Tax=Salvia splendens TaxID=180675 RepID=A0A8X8YJD1_SALSN|nr:hypothetical protein SASPL_105165 [Salvia splendens]